MSEYFARRDLVCSIPEPGWNYGHGRSPFYKYNIAQDATYVVYNRRMMPVSLSTCTREEGYWALRRDVTRLDTGEYPTQVSGPDAGALLDRIFTRRISTLKVGRCAYGLALWDDGGILVDGIVMRLAEDTFWYVQADGDFVGWLKAHSLGMNVRITDPESYVHQLQGPKAMALLADACDDGMPENFRYFDCREVRMGGQEVLITRTGWTGEMGFEVYARPSNNTDALWDHMTEAGKAHNLIDIGLDPMDTRRIEAAILNNISDMDSTMNPFEAGLGEFCDLDREDHYFGKDALQNVDRRTRIYGVKCMDAEPLIGGPVSRDGKQIGIITAASWSPYLNCGVGYVRLSSADEANLRSATVVGFDLADHPCEIVDLPFYDADKLIPRGLLVEDV
jgi:aminomethyltransferase